MFKKDLIRLIENKPSILCGIIHIQSNFILYSNWEYLFWRVWSVLLWNLLIIRIIINKCDITIQNNSRFSQLNDAQTERENNKNY